MVSFYIVTGHNQHMIFKAFSIKPNNNLFVFCKVCVLLSIFEIYMYMYIPLHSSIVNNKTQHFLLFSFLMLLRLIKMENNLISLFTISILN